MIISAGWLRTSIKFSGQEYEEIPSNIGNFVAGADSSKHKVVIAMESATIIQV